MFYLLLQIWFWLIFASIAGFFIGWFIWGKNTLTAEDRIGYRVYKARQGAVELKPGYHHIGSRYRKRTSTAKKRWGRDVVRAQDL